MISRTFKSDYRFSKTDSCTVILVQELELKPDITKVEIDDTRYLSCLSVVPLVMDATYIQSVSEYYLVCIFLIIPRMKMIC